MNNIPKTEVALYGALRSGTTLLRLMLHQNTRISSPGETDFLLDHITSVDQGAGQLDFPQLLRDRFYRGVISDYDAIPQDENAIPAIIEALTDRPEKSDPQLVLIHHRNLELLLKQFPDIKIIHLIRDPRDVARSSIGMGWAGSTYYGVNHWLETEADWLRFGQSLPKDRVLAVKYENMITDAEYWLTKMCDFIDVPYQDAMMDYDQISTYDKPDPKLIYQWRTKQTPREIGLVEGRVGHLMRDLGYEPSGHKALKPGWLGKVWLTLHHKVTTWRGRFKAFGVIDPILAAVARRLNWPALSRKADIRIEKKLLSQVK